MCGLCGVARHPDSLLDTEGAVSLLEASIKSIEQRGVHATGVAFLQHDNSGPISKWAATASKVLASEAWQEATKLADKAPIFMGHTRHSTHHDNTHLDDAAHPFRVGGVVGAHNGMVLNWQKVRTVLQKKRGALYGADWLVDSQAALGALDVFKASKALSLLDGYWALTWTKGKHLFMTRAGGAPLAVAYIPDLRTLVWNSTEEALVKVVSTFTDIKHETWVLKPETLYVFDVRTFDQHGSHVQKFPLKLHRKTATTSAMLEVTSGYTHHRVPAAPDWWDSERAEEKPSPAQITLHELRENQSRLLALVQKLTDKVQTLDAEIDYLRDILEEHGMMMGDEVQGDLRLPD
jgi:glucosamine 6-phosphate synthetase-like amidotransferase/phosphosugar isomerase protein